MLGLLPKESLKGTWSRVTSTLGLHVKVDLYFTLGTATSQANYTIGVCNPFIGGTSMKVSTYSANSGSASKVSWGMVFAVVLSQLL